MELQRITEKEIVFRSTDGPGDAIRINNVENRLDIITEFISDSILRIESYIDGEIMKDKSSCDIPLKNGKHLVMNLQLRKTKVLNFFEILYYNNNEITISMKEQDTHEISTTLIKMRRMISSYSMTPHEKQLTEKIDKCKIILKNLFSGSNMITKRKGFSFEIKDNKLGIFIEDLKDTCYVAPYKLDEKYEESLFREVAELYFYMKTSNGEQLSTINEKIDKYINNLFTLILSNTVLELNDVSEDFFESKKYMIMTKELEESISALQRIIYYSSAVESERHEFLDNFISLENGKDIINKLKMSRNDLIEELKTRSLKTEFSSIFEMPIFNNDDKSAEINEYEFPTIVKPENKRIVVYEPEYNIGLHEDIDNEIDKEVKRVSQYTKRKLDEPKKDEDVFLRRKTRIDEQKADFRRFLIEDSDEDVEVLRVKPRIHAALLESDEEDNLVKINPRNTVTRGYLMESDDEIPRFQSIKSRLIEFNRKEKEPKPELTRNKLFNRERIESTSRNEPVEDIVAPTPKTEKETSSRRSRFMLDPEDF